MKRLGISALSILTSFVCACVAYAQNDASGLIQKETVTVVKVDLTKIDSETLSGAVQKIGSAAIDYFVDEADKASEMKETLPFASLLVGQAFSEFVAPVQATGADAVYIVGEQPEEGTEALYPYVAVPTKGMTDAQKKELRDAFANINSKLSNEAPFTLKYRFERNGYFFVLVVPSNLEQSEVKAYIKKRFTKIATVESPAFANGFNVVPSNAIVSGVQRIVVNTDLVAEQLEGAFAQLGAMTGNDDVVSKIESIVEKGSDLAAKVDYNVFYVALDEPEVAVTFKAKSESDAQEYASGMNENFLVAFNAIVDYAVSMAMQTASENGAEGTDEEKAKIEELKVEAGNLATLFVNFKAEGDLVTWKMNEKFWVDNKVAIKKFVEFVKGIAPKSDEEADVEAEEAEADIEL